MKTATRKIRSPLKWHGGKSYLCRRFIGLFPEHETYVEPFAGGLSTLLNKPECEHHEVACDLNFNLIRFWKALQSHGPEIAGRLRDTPYSEESFDAAKELAPAVDDPAEFACRFLSRNRMSRGGLGRDFAWSDRLRGGQPGDVNAWETFLKDDLPRVIERVEHVEFRCADAVSLIRDFSDYPYSPLIYADPPYLHETRTHRDAYEFEMSREDHVGLLDALRDCRCKVFLSGYRSALYDEALAGWTRHEFPMPNHSGQGKTKQRRIECLWESPDR